MLKTLVTAVGFATLLTIAGCSSGGDGGGAGGSGGSSAAGGSGGGGVNSSSPCYAYCMARETKMDCNPNSSIEDCLGYTYGCDDFSTRSSGCKTALTAYWTCTAAQANPCDNPGSCTTQADALGTACN